MPRPISPIFIRAHSKKAGALALADTPSPNRVERVMIVDRSFRPTLALAAAFALAIGGCSLATLASRSADATVAALDPPLGWSLRHNLLFANIRRRSAQLRLMLFCDPGSPSFFIDSGRRAPDDFSDLHVRTDCRSVAATSIPKRFHSAQYEWSGAHARDNRQKQTSRAIRHHAFLETGSISVRPGHIALPPMPARRFVEIPR